MKKRKILEIDLSPAKASQDYIKCNGEIWPTGVSFSSDRVNDQDLLRWGKAYENNKTKNEKRRYS